MTRKDKGPSAPGGKTDGGFSSPAYTTRQLCKDADPVCFAAGDAPPLYASPNHFGIIISGHQLLVPEEVLNDAPRLHAAPSHLAIIDLST
jgi:hypothetical protein